MEKFDFAGWGKSRILEDLGDDVDFTELGVPQANVHKLGQWQATAICGNDITSSCLYVSALAIMVAGAYAPIALLMVAAVLFLFRKIYGEVGSAIPLNGGTYTVLLNTTNKKLAAAAACLTLLSYIATGVISASEAMHYAHHLWNGLNVTTATIVLLGIFAFLNLLGISESAFVALGIFIIHIFTLCVLSVSGIIFIMNDPSILLSNFQNPLPMSDISIGGALFYGFAAAMLGISGFESSANFIEEQKKGVFPKTLRNMWIAVSVFNPLLCLLAIGIMGIPEIADHKTSLLAVMGERTSGITLRSLISIDAVLVLSGAVLTSYVGVIGLVRRMSLDRCLPPILLKENKWRKTNHWIIISFFGFCCSILLISKGEVDILAGVYTISFLCVMMLYAIGNMLLKQKRDNLPRSERASWFAVGVALVAVGLGLIGNLSLEKIEIFLEFFLIMVLVVAVMLFRVYLLKVGLFILNGLLSGVKRFCGHWLDLITKQITLINAQAVVYFTRADNMANLNQAALYVLENEQTNNIIVVHFYDEKVGIPEGLAQDLKTIDHLYPHLRIDFLAVKGEFTPQNIEKLSKKLGIQKNNMFIGTPGDRFSHSLESLGGVRLII